MKCPHCGAWNQAYLPKCIKCGAPLIENTLKTKPWEADLHKKKPSLQIAQFEDGEESVNLDVQSDAHYDPESYDQAGLSDEIEELKQRRQEGAKRLSQMKQQVERLRHSLEETDVIIPAPEPGDPDPIYTGDRQAITRRQQDRQNDYEQNLDSFSSNDVHTEKPDTYGYFSDTPGERPLTYSDDDQDAPYYYDGYTPEHGEYAAMTDEEYMPRRIQTRASLQDSYDSFNSASRRSHRLRNTLLKLAVMLLCLVLVGVGGVLIAREFVLRQGMQVKQDHETRIALVSTTYDGHPAHRLTIYGKENATVYIKEMQSSYVIADGKVEITIPDYMWYDTESSTFAVDVQEDTMDVTISPYIRYSQEGEQYALEPVSFTIDVPLSTVYLLNPPTMRAEVGVSIFEVRLNVALGSTVIIDGTNVSTLIRDTGNVSKNVQVLPVGDNVISISVKSKYCRENKMEITLYREPQDIQLELDATVLVEWNYEPITEEQYLSASNEEKSKMNLALISGRTEPGATITVDFPHWGLEQDFTTGDFSFRPMFSALGNNSVPIRASKEGREDSVITHTVYYMPNADIYTRRAWDLEGQYADLVNYINIRKGKIYTGTGTISRIISTAPQMAVMVIGEAPFQKEVMLENSSKTTWTVGTRYRIYGDVYGMYDTMPRLTVRYTYLDE